MQIKELRKLMGVKQGTLAKEMGVSQPTVSDWESGKINPTIDNLIFLSKYFSVSVGCIVGTEPIPEGYPETVQVPIQYTEIVKDHTKAAEEIRTYDAKKKKAPFTQEQIAYLDEWGDKLTEKIVDSLKEDTFSLRETGTKAE